MVRLLHLQYGYPNPLDNELIKLLYTLLLRGIRRTSQKAVAPPKLPITPPILRAIRRELDLTVSFDATFWAACLIAFYSFFRKANLLSQSRAKFDNRLHLRWSNFNLFAWGATMTVCWNKTIQFRQRTLLLPLPKMNDLCLCPLAALLKAFDLTRHADPCGPAFTYREGSTILPLTYSKF